VGTHIYYVTAKNGSGSTRISVSIPWNPKPVITGVISTDQNFSGVNAPLKLNQWAYFQISGNNFMSAPDLENAWTLTNCETGSMYFKSATQMLVRCMPRAAGNQTFTIKDRPLADGGQVLPNGTWPFYVNP